MWTCFQRLSGPICWQCNRLSANLEHRVSTTPRNCNLQLSELDWYYYSIKANLHRHARHDKAVLYVSRPPSVAWTGFPTMQVRRRQTIWSLNTFRAIVQFTSARQTRHGQNRLVVSGVAVWIESTRRSRDPIHTDWTVLSCLAGAETWALAALWRCC